VRIDWSERALTDLAAVHDYISKDSVAYADRFLARLVRAADALADFPELGRRVPEEPRQSDLREILFQSYRIVYRIEADRILVATVLHGSRNPRARGSAAWDDPDARRSLAPT
jgi:plasmid stabilization system protein ParE